MIIHTCSGICRIKEGDVYDILDNLLFIVNWSLCVFSVCER